MACWSAVLLAANPTQAPPADASVVSPPEPVQLRGQPKPNELPLSKGPVIAQ